jgi:hypothetical protein
MRAPLPHGVLHEEHLHDRPAREITLLRFIQRDPVLVDQHRLEKALDPVLEPAHPGAVAPLSRQTMSASVTTRCCIREVWPVGSARMMTSVAGLSVLRTHFGITSSSLARLRSPQTSQVTIRCAVATRRTYLAGRGTDIDQAA